MPYAPCLKMWMALNAEFKLKKQSNIHILSNVKNLTQLLSRIVLVFLVHSTCSLSLICTYEHVLYFRCYYIFYIANIFFFKLLFVLYSCKHISGFMLLNVSFMFFLYFFLCYYSFLCHRLYYWAFVTAYMFRQLLYSYFDLNSLCSFFLVLYITAFTFSAYILLELLHFFFFFLLHSTFLFTQNMFNSLGYFASSPSPFLSALPQLFVVFL